MSTQPTLRRAGKLAIALMSAWTAGSSPVTASVDASNERGFVASKAFTVGEFDLVNQFNGGLTFHVPLGGTYSVGPDLQFGFTLSYSSVLWDYRKVHGVNGRAGAWFGLENISEQLGYVATGRSSDFFNAGLGWRLSFGELLEPAPENGCLIDAPPCANDDPSWVYLAPDGSAHYFQPAPGGLLMTRDGTYLRFRNEPDTGRWVDFPNGVSHHFSAYALRDGSGPVYRVDWIQDASGGLACGGEACNWVSIDYGPAGNGTTWTIADSYGRSFAVDLEPWGVGDSTSRAPLRVVAVRVPDPSDPAGIAQTTYRLEYHDSLKSIRPGCITGLETSELHVRLLDSVYVGDPDASPREWEWRFGYSQLGESSILPEHCSLDHGRLDYAKLPTGAEIRYKWAKFFMGVSSCQEGQPGIGPGPHLPAAANAGPAHFGVAEKRVTYRENGVERELLHWERFPSGAFVPNFQDVACFALKPWMDLTIGTSSRIGNGQVLRTQNFYSVWNAENAYIPSPERAAEGWDPDEYGLPFTRRPVMARTQASNEELRLLPEGVENPLLFDGRKYFLSSLQFRCPMDGEAAPEPAATGQDPDDWTPGDYDWGGQWRGFEPGANCDLYEARYVDYEREYACASPSQGGCRDADQRPVREAIVSYKPELAPGDRGVTRQNVKIVDRGEYNGFGNYGFETTDGDFNGSAAANVRETSTSYLYSIDNATGQAIVPPHDAPWQVQLYSSITTTEPGKGSQRRDFCFDSSSGFLLGERLRLKPTEAPSDRDLVTLYAMGSSGGGKSPELASFGLPIRKHLMGGDLSTAPTGSLCNAGSAAAESTEEIDYQFGVAAERWVLRGSARWLRLEANTVHPSGLVSRSLGASDWNGVSYLYDQLGRIKKVAPDGAAATEITYDIDAEAGPQAFVAKRSGGFLAQERYTYDGLGRLVQEERTVPSSTGGQTWACRRTQLTPQGWIQRQSKFLPFCPDSHGLAADEWTTYGHYDPLGRPESVQEPDGREVQFVYFGDRQKVTKSWVRLGGTSDTKVEREETFDRQGRLVKLVEGRIDGEPAANEQTTSYGYHVGGQLELVTMSRVTGGVNMTQRREMSYDPRGVLEWERYPEIAKGDGSAFGTLCYGDFTTALECLPAYNSRGQATRLRYEPGEANLGDKDREFAFDRAGRLTQVSVWDEPFKEYFYSRADSISSEGYREPTGSLVLSKRRNLVLSRNEPLDRVVTERFGYDNAGRMAFSQVRTNEGPVFKTTVVFDPLGNPTSISYPACQYPADCESASGAASRTITNDYREGLLTSVAGYAQISYHANGMWNEVLHTNGTRDVQTPHRPASAPDFPLPMVGKIQFYTGASQLREEIGPFKYDGSSNVVEIGTDKFLYDRFQRLTNASYGGQAQSPGQTFGYDGFSNLIAMTAVNGGPPSRTLPVDPASNRLEDGIAYAYDQAGNMVHYVGLDRSFDAANQMVSETGQGVNRRMLYDADDERVAILDDSSVTRRERWTLRGGGTAVLRELAVSWGASSADWTWSKDYVYRGGSLLAAVSSAPDGSTATYHYHLDHLGGVRQVTNDQAGVTERIKLWPYGELFEGAAEGERMRFTGHERDFNCTEAQCAGDRARIDDVDYMHARYLSPWLGRFLSIDPAALRHSNTASLNRYNYVSGSPVNAIDPDGREEVKLNLKPPSPQTLAGWTPEQGAQEDMKNIQRHISTNRGELTLAEGARSSQYAPEATKLLGPRPPGAHVDHIVDLQLGGPNSAGKNSQYLDGSVNTSNGTRTQAAIRASGGQPGQKVTAFNFVAIGRFTGTTRGSGGGVGGGLLSLFLPSALEFLEENHICILSCAWSKEDLEREKDPPQPEETPTTGGRRKATQVTDI